LKINEFDFTDADLLEKIEQGKNDVLEKLKIVEDNTTNPVEGIRQECKILRDFLDYVFGEGTSDENIKHKNSLRECIKVYEDVFKEKERQLNNLSEIANKYSPERVQR
jgi:hypothetical protein